MVPKANIKLNCPCSPMLYSNPESVFTTTKAWKTLPFSFKQVLKHE